MSIAIIALVIVSLVIFIYIYTRREGFASRQDKVNTIHDWWTKTAQPTYSKYKREITGSDVVEYNKAKKLYDSDIVSKENLSNVLT